MGLDTSRRLLDAGARVTVWARHRTPEIDGLGVEFHEVDVTVDPQTADRDAPALPESLHGVAYFPGSIQLAPFERIRIEAFRSDLEVNLLGAVRVLQRAIPVLARSGGGSVVLVSTVAASRGMPYHASVAAAKSALEGLGRSLAAEYAAKRVRVNLLAPSLTETPLAERLVNTPEKRERSAARHPLGRIGTTADMAEATLYLLGDGSSWMTGQVLHVDGGLSALSLS